MPFRLPSDLILDPERGFRIYEGVVAPDWTDRNGHMNVVYYRRAFDQATQHMLSRIGLWDNDNDYGSTFALEDHVTYQHELHPGRPFFVTYQLLDFSDKLIHAFLRLFGEPESPGGQPVLAATCEHIGVYVDMRTRRSARCRPSTTNSFRRSRAAWRSCRSPPKKAASSASATALPRNPFPGASR